MGQYLLSGVCHQMLILKQEWTLEQLNQALSREIDLSLYDVEETDDYIRYVIKESLIVDQLHDFMQQLMSLYNQAYQDDFTSVLSEIKRKQTLAALVELAKEKQFAFFQDGDIYDHLEIVPWFRTRVHISLLIIFVEGKIMMECYDNHLRFHEKLVRNYSALPISGAFRSYIQ